jgi:hypothetical protein
MLDIGSSRGWTVVLLVMIVIGLIPLVPMVVVDRKPAYITTGILRVSPVLPRQDPNSEAEMAQFMSHYEAFKNTAASRLASDRVLNLAVDKLAGLELDYFRDAPNRVVALRQAIKSRQIVIDTPRQTQRIMIRMTGYLPFDAETIVNSLLDSCVEVENATTKPQSLTVLEDQRRLLLLKMEQPDQKDRARGMYNEVTRRIQDIEDKSRRPARVLIDIRAQSVPTAPYWKRWITPFTVIEALLVVALIGNLIWMFLRPSVPYQSDPDNR